MTVLDRSELEASSLADLHLIADQIGLEGFRRLRKADLIDALLGQSGGAGDTGADDDSVPEPEPESRSPRRGRSRSRRGSARAASSSSSSAEEDERDEERGAAPRRRRGRSERDSEEREPEAVGEGVVEIQANGSALLLVSPPEHSDQDVYVSAAQVRRCELVSGDRVSGPVRTPRRSERYPSLVRIDTINGVAADTVTDAPRFEELAVSYPSERLELDSQDPTLKAIEWLTPIGLGSRTVITGAARAGKTETLRAIATALVGREELQPTLVLVGVRPEEIAEWGDGPLAPAAALNFAASADSQGQAVERAIDAAKRAAIGGAHALVLIDTLDGLHPQSARKALASARNLSGGGSLTVIATCARPFGGESTVIALDAALTSTGRLPALDLMASGTLRAELLVGEDGARAIIQARASRMGD